LGETRGETNLTIHLKREREREREAKNVQKIFWPS